MYNKLFAKIVNSSVWLEPDPILRVWITLMATMDQDGFSQFAAIGNLAHTARVELEVAKTAVEKFQSPDPESSDPEFEGRRIERVPGGFMVLNAKKYRDLATKELERAQTRERVRKHREKKAGNASESASSLPETVGNGNVTHRNDFVTPSEAETESEEEASEPKISIPHQTAGSQSSLLPGEKIDFSKRNRGADQTTAEWRVFDHWRQVHGHPRAQLDAKRMKAVRAALKLYDEAALCQAISGYLNSPHHMGTDPKGSGTKYDELTLFLRDAAHIDAGLRFYELGQPAGSGPVLSANTKQSLAAMQSFLSRGESNGSI